MDNVIDEQVGEGPPVDFHKIKDFFKISLAHSY